MDLNDSIVTLPSVGQMYQKKLEKLGIFTIQDLFYHIPHKYLDYRKIINVRNIRPGEIGTIQGKVESIKNVFTKFGKRFQIANVKTITGNLQIIWFNQIFLTRTIAEGEMYSFSGKIDWFSRKLTMISPDYEKIVDGLPLTHTGGLIPVYPETHGVSSKWLRTKLQQSWVILKPSVKDFIDPDELKELRLMELKSSFETIHYPIGLDLTDEAKRRLAFNELFFHQIKSLVRKSQRESLQSSLKLKVNKKLKDEFINIMPFTLTESQVRSINEVYSDLEKDVPMNRLLEGDVGSGKTVVAAAACFAAFAAGYQSVIMAPTQILATQHYETLLNIFSKLNIRITLVTGSEVKTGLGKTDIFIGTHALIHKKISFEKVAVVVIDEQHRFGVEQRSHLIKKGTKRNKVPNVLTMTATPIPRSVAQTLYGDLDLSILDELPKGRLPVTTWIVPQAKRPNSYAWVKEQIQKDKIQVFVICPLIEESASESMKQVKAAKVMYEDLTEEFKGYNLALLHGKLKSKEKDEVLAKFRDGSIDILVTTPVVEVGIDIPNASIMIIEAGERYGLAQLHQLRGRIGRGDKKSYCLVFTSVSTEKSNQRLVALTKSLSGFELSELDLKLRGPGELLGTRQHGFPELRIASWGDSELIMKSRKYAENVMSDNNKFTQIKDLLKLNEISLS